MCRDKETGLFLPFLSSLRNGRLWSSYAFDILTDCSKLVPYALDLILDIEMDLRKLPEYVIVLYRTEVRASGRRRYVGGRAPRSLVSIR
jgi:hypothetical protein